MLDLGIICQIALAIGTVKNYTKKKKMQPGRRSNLKAVINLTRIPLLLQQAHLAELVMPGLIAGKGGMAPLLQ